MSSFKNLEMAAAVSAYPNISVRKSFFGLSQRVVYGPAQAPVAIIVNDYSPAEGERLERLLKLPVGKMDGELQGKGAPKPSDIGHYRLEACLSEDHQFAALQLFRFVDFKNTPVMEPRFYTGKEAEVVAKLF